MKKDYFNTLEESDLLIHEDLEFDAKKQHISSVIEMYFDVDKKFGINVSQDENAWVNLYADYNPVTGSLKILYYIDTFNENYEREYIPTEEEKSTFISAIQQACIRQNDMSCREFYIREYSAFAGEISLSCERDGNRCQIINTDDGFILFSEDMADGNPANHLGHHIELANYGNGECISIECTDCNEVLYSTDNDGFVMSNEQEQKM